MSDCQNFCNRYDDSSDSDGIGGNVVFTVEPIPSSIEDTREITIVAKLLEAGQPVQQAAVPDWSIPLKVDT